jgi:hypothetical protein
MADIRHFSPDNRQVGSASRPMHVRTVLVETQRVRRGLCGVVMARKAAAQAKECLCCRVPVRSS